MIRALAVPVALLTLALAGCGDPGAAGPRPASSTATALAGPGGGSTPRASATPTGPLAWLVTADTSQETGMSVMLCSAEPDALNSLADDYEPDIQLAGHETTLSDGQKGRSSMEVVFEAQDGNPPLFYYYSNTDILFADVIELRGPLTVTRAKDGAITGASGTGRTDTHHPDGSVDHAQDAWVKLRVTRVPDSGYCLG